MDAFLQDATQEIKVAVERNEGKISVWTTCIHGTQSWRRRTTCYLERYVKFLLWSVGGFRVYLCGAGPLCQRMQAEYVLTETEKGKRWFDVQFMTDVFESGFEIIDCSPEDFPKQNDASAPGRPVPGRRRIGFDAGGSDARSPQSLTARRSTPKRSSGIQRPRQTLLITLQKL